MKQPDWSTVPEGATHFHPGNDKYAPHWYKEGYFCVIGREGGGWVKDLLPQPTSAMIPRPTTPQWNGEGLPPAGTVCEAKCTGQGKELGWFVATINYISPYTAVMDDRQAGEFVAHPATMQFRPIRTAEQIAAEKRAAQIAAMEAIYLSVAPGHGRMAALYDAGCRMTAEDER